MLPGIGDGFKRLSGGVLTRLGDSFRHLSYDLPFRLVPNVNVSNENVVLIEMDEGSTPIEEQDPRQPAWDRGVHTKLLKVLSDQGAQLVVFDVLFDFPSKDTNVDIAFAQAMQAHGKVIVGAKLNAYHEGVGGEPILPVDVIRSAASFGITDLIPGTDKVVRMHFYPTRNPGMALKVAEALGKYPTNEVQNRWINYYGPPGSLGKRMSYYQALEPSLSPSYFTGKRVFIGQASHTGVHGTKYETLPTPLGDMSGVEVLATTCINFLRGDWITEMSLPTQFLLVILAGLVCGFGFFLVRPWTAAGLALLGFLLVAGAAVLLVGQYRIWFPWLIIGGAQIPCALVWTLFWNTRTLYREKEALQKRLATAHLDTDPSFVEEGTPKTPQPVLASPLGETRFGPGNSARATVSPVELERPTERGPQIPDHDLVRRVGKGGYGEVWLARDAIGSFHAVKIVYRKTFSNDGPFDREFRGIQKFTPISRSHPGFVHILHVGRNDQAGHFYYIMEVGDDEVAGQKIDPGTYSPKNLAREIDKRGRLPFAECLQLSLDLTAALDYLHRQHLIHRDLKPSNIIFVNGSPKIADIGLVTHIAETGHQVTYLGTEGYIAPEGPGSPAGDVYSLGKVIYEASMGRDLDRFGELPSSLRETPDHDNLLRLNEIILKACKPDLRGRYQSMAEMRSDLLRMVQA